MADEIDHLALFQPSCKTSPFLRRNPSASILSGSIGQPRPFGDLCDGLIIFLPRFGLAVSQAVKLGLIRSRMVQAESISPSDTER